eukprot:m.132938 g.132938  ORF g.132938 m.132938 type:complete len:346 (-) comp22480_c0_seq2:167-1204(-)
MVTFAGSPPNAAIFRRTHRNASRVSCIPKLPAVPSDVVAWTARPPSHPNAPRRSACHCMGHAQLVRRRRVDTDFHMPEKCRRSNKHAAVHGMRTNVQLAVTRTKSCLYLNSASPLYSDVPPITKDPPWIQKRTGSAALLDPLVTLLLLACELGAHTFRYRHDSPIRADSTPFSLFQYGALTFSMQTVMRGVGSRSTSVARGGLSTHSWDRVDGGRGSLTPLVHPTPGSTTKTSTLSSTPTLPLLSLVHIRPDVSLSWHGGQCEALESYTVAAELSCIDNALPCPDWHRRLPPQGPHRMLRVLNPSCSQPASTHGHVGVVNHINPEAAVGGIDNGSRCREWTVPTV